MRNAQVPPFRIYKYYHSLDNRMIENRKPRLIFTQRTSCVDLVVLSNNKVQGRGSLQLSSFNLIRGVPAIYHGS